MILGNLITESGTRDVVSEDRLRGLLALRGMSRADLSSTLTFLENRRVVNRTAQRGTYYYEVASEYLLQSIQKEMQQLALEQERAEAERQRRRAEDEARAAENLSQLVKEREAERNRAKQQARLSFSRELAAAAISNLDIDPERSVLLALHAVSVTYSIDKAVTTEAEDALHRSVQALRVRLTLTGHTDSVYGVTFSPDGVYLATASFDGTAKMWDIMSDQEVLTLTGHNAAVLGVAFSPDGTRLATTSWQTAKVWDVTSGQEICTLTGHTDWVSSVAFSPDGTRLATASQDKTARVWDAGSGREVLILRGHTDMVWSVAFSPDGTRLATASADKTVHVYTSKIEDLIALALTCITRSLTLEECRKYLHVEECPRTAVALVVEGKNLAKAGDVDSAIASFRNALELEPTLDLNPEADARRLAAEGLVAKGQYLARAGDVDSAIASFRDALELEPTLDLNPEADARRLAAEGLGLQGEARGRK
jgi:WD domain, G-beta repeat/Tetratricopeptide repeat